MTAPRQGGGDAAARTGEPAPTGALVPPHRRRVSLLGDRDFLVIWSVGAISSTIRWLEMLAIGVFVFEVTGSPLQVALMSILRMAPLALFGAIAGAVSERVSRRTLLLVGLVVMSGVAGVLAALVWTQHVRLWHVGVGAVLSGMFWVLDFPVRRTVLGDIAGPMRLGAAMSLDTVTNNGTRVLGPMLGGLLLEVLGLAGVYLLGAGLYLAATMLMLRLRVPAHGLGGAVVGVARSIADGLRHLRSQRVLAGVLVVTVIFNLWGFPFVAMIPVIGKDELGLSPLPVGLLMSAEGAGALLGALLIAAFGQMRHYRRLYTLGTALYLCMALAFSQSPWPVTSALLLLAVGLGTAAFAAMQSTLILLCTPAGLRGRMMGVLSVCIGTAPLGFAHIGMLADIFGAPTAVAISAAEGLLALLVTCWLWPELTAAQPLPE